MKVSAVVVTYNRLSLLQRCIWAIRSQTESVHETIVVNNSSTDGTLEWLVKQQDLTIITQENSGSSGGQRTGIAAALESGSDWIWVMDDDTEPAEDCVERLLECAHSMPAFVAPLVYGSKKASFELYHNKRLIKTYFGFKYYTAEEWFPRKENEDVTCLPIDANGFVGILINAERAREVGLPREDFFILLDDLEYTFRLTRGFPAVMAPKARVIHHDPPEFVAPGIFDPQNYWKLYYYVRNQIVFIRINRGRVCAILMGITLLLGYSVRFIIRPRRETMGSLSLRYKGILDGLIGRGGKRVEPGQRSWLTWSEICR